MQGQPLEKALARALRAEEVRETHTSSVFLTTDRAYKLKKPVRFGFVDLTTREARRRSCEEEVRVNQTLAPNIVLGVRAVVAAGDTLRLEDARDARAIDWVVEMVRFDERRTMAAVAARGELTPDDARRVGQ